MTDFEKRVEAVARVLHSAFDGLPGNDQEFVRVLAAKLGKTFLDAGDTVYTIDRQKMSGGTDNWCSSLVPLRPEGDG